ncbi:hypothetical protein NPIL_331781 [Nephila pilipes]|uniref:Uncharacterized protein n=1 Tax=Nephila pilipes TaxID=299642 RepID=A0A8X6Q1I1_NEPPI|nr:hypothetical protein NPIL_331781 [Nephila pilipes]
MVVDCDIGHGIPDFYEVIYKYGHLGPKQQEDSKKKVSGEPHCKNKNDLLNYTQILGIPSNKLCSKESSRKNILYIMESIGKILDDFPL